MPTLPALGTKTGGPGLSYGLDGISDWGPAQVFLNVFKSAREWTGHLPDQWGGIDIHDMRAAGLLDENGYFTRMPDGVTHVDTFVLTDLPVEATYTAGRYRLTYDGTGDVSVSISAQNVTYDEGEIWFDFAPAAGDPDSDSMVVITINTTDPEGTGDHLRNFELVKEENIPTYDAGAVFNPLWLELIDETHALRFMDWIQTNNSTIVGWDDRPTLDDFSYVPGVPLEVMVDLANLTGTEPWFNIPHNASDDYIRQFSQYVRDTLDPTLRAHFEFSNEVWNFLFDQAIDSAADAEIRFGTGVEGAWMQEYGVRSSQMAMLLDEVYAGAEDQLVKVIATHTGWPGLEVFALEAPDYLSMTPGLAAPYTFFDTYAVTGYFGNSLGNKKAETVLTWLADSLAQAVAEADALGLTGADRSTYVEANRFVLATELATQDLRDGSVTGDPSGSLAEVFDSFAYHAAAAESYGLDLVMYEGGTHVVANGEFSGNQDLAEFFLHLNYSAEMGVLYQELLDGWVAAGGTLFSAFVEVAKPSQWGSWGSLRYLGDETERQSALETFLTDYPRVDAGQDILDPTIEVPDPTGEPDPTPDPDLDPVLPPDLDTPDPGDSTTPDAGTDPAQTGLSALDGLLSGVSPFQIAYDGLPIETISDGAGLPFSDPMGDDENLGTAPPMPAITDSFDPAVQGYSALFPFIAPAPQTSESSPLPEAAGDVQASLLGTAWRDAATLPEAQIGSDGNDILTLLPDQRAESGPGEDTLIDADGAEIMLGGAGADVFVFLSRDRQIDQIVDFERGVDKIDLTGWNTDWTALSITGDSSGTAMVSVPGDTLRIDNAWNPTTGEPLLAADDFIF